MTKHVIQLIGQARSGKDWTAEKLKLYYESIGESVEVLSYATPLKQITAELFGISLKQLDEYKNNQQNVSVKAYDYNLLLFATDFRTILQRIGNEAIKPIFGDNVWAKLMQQSINSSTADIIIIPDCRFQTELALIGGVTLRIVNNALPEPSNHASEIELVDIQTDYTLDNTYYTMTPLIIGKLAQRIYDEQF